MAAYTHRLYSSPSFWNLLHPDLPAGQHLADTVQLPALAATGTEEAVGLITGYRVSVNYLNNINNAANSWMGSKAETSVVIGKGTVGAVRKR